MVWFGPVQGQNLNPDLRSSSQNFTNLNLSSREPQFRSSSGSSGVWTWTRPKGIQGFHQMHADMHSWGVPRWVIPRESHSMRMQTQMQAVGLTAWLLTHSQSGVTRPRPYIVLQIPCNVYDRVDYKKHIYMLSISATWPSRMLSIVWSHSASTRAAICPWQ